MLPGGLWAALALGIDGARAAQVNVAEVQVAPPSITVRVGERFGVIATAFDRIGNVIPTVRFIWSSNNVNVARVDNNGTVSGVSNGVAIIEARAGQRKGQAAVQVISAPIAPPPAQQQPAPPVQQPASPAGADPFAGQPAGAGPAAALRIEPAAIYLLPSENTRAAPRALREDGSPAAPVVVTWKSLRDDVATVDQSGNVVALAPGQGTIQITGPSGLTATAPVVVQRTEVAIAGDSALILAPGEIDTLRVVVPAQNSRSVNPLALQWSSSDPGVAPVSVTGIVTAASPGRATLSVTGLLQTRSIEVAVHRQVEQFAVRPTRQQEVQVPLTTTLKFAITPLAADNAPIPEARVRWSVADTGIASFDPVTGLLLGKKVGKTQLTARGPGQGLSVTWQISVMAGSVKLVQPRVGVGPGQRVTLRGNYADSAGAAIAPATNLTWSSDNPQVATVGEDGTVGGVEYGHARVTATAPGGKTATADVYVVGEIVVASSRTGRFQLYFVERSNLAQLHKISSDTSSAYDPAFSADGSRIASVSTRDGHSEISVMNADGTGATRLTSDPPGDGHPVFTPDGQVVLFHSQRASGKPQIWAVNVDGSGLTQLTRDSTNLAPAVSPDGQIVAFMSTREKTSDIWLMARDGSNQRAFTKSPEQKETEPRFLRDGTLAYLLERRAANRPVTQVVRADLTTGSVTPLTGTDLAITSFAITPAGDLLALVMNSQPENRRNPVYKVYIQPVGSATAVPLPTIGTDQMLTPTFRP